MLDLAVEQALSPALRRVSRVRSCGVMLEHGIPLEAILTELFLSGEVERTYRLLRLEGYAAQMEHHSPTSQYGQLSRVPEFDHLDVAGPMREIVDDIASGALRRRVGRRARRRLPQVHRAQGRRRRRRHGRVRSRPPPPARRDRG